MLRNAHHIHTFVADSTELQKFAQSSWDTLLLHHSTVMQAESFSREWSIGAGGNVN